MDLELEKKLFEKYPKIFRQKDLPINCTAMCWGIDCGNGWYWLIDNLCGCIQNYLDSNPSIYIRRKNFRYHLLKAYNLFLDLLPGGIFKALYREFEFFGYASYKTEKIKRPQVEATQVKEKFGGLRFYTIHSDRLVDGMIWFAECLSNRTCEICGSTKDVSQTEVWVNTLCSECLKKL